MLPYGNAGDESIDRSHIGRPDRLPAVVLGLVLSHAMRWAAGVRLGFVALNR